MDSNYEWIKLGDKMILIENMVSEEDLETGMKKYNSPPQHGMLFIMGDRYSYLTMKGVKFPLDIIFFDKNRQPIPINTKNKSTYWLRAYPEQEDVLLPRETYYMIEFPAGLVYP